MGDIPSDILNLLIRDNITAYDWIYNNSFPYEDDYVHIDEDKFVYISKSQIVYFFAALCFIITGVLDCFNRYPGWFNSLVAVGYIMAGVFGVISAMFETDNMYYSALFNSISVHLFLLEAIGLAIRHSKAMSRTMKLYLWFGDVTFFVGSLMDVVLSYHWVINTFSIRNYRFAVLHAVAACFWLSCAVVYLTHTIWMEYTLNKASNGEQKNDSQSGETPVEEFSLEEDPVKINVSEEAPSNSYSYMGAEKSFDPEEIECEC